MQLCQPMGTCVAAAQISRRGAQNFGDESMELLAIANADELIGDGLEEDSHVHQLIPEPQI